MVSTGTVFVSQSSGTPKITADADALLVYNSFRTVLPPPMHALPSTRLSILQFYHVTQQLLNILIGKANILTSVPIIGPPVSASLRNLESVVDVSTYTWRVRTHISSPASTPRTC